MDNTDNTPQYDINEVFMEAMADESWEPDKEKREAAIFGLMMGMYM